MKDESKTGDKTLRIVSLCVNIVALAGVIFLVIILLGKQKSAVENVSIFVVGDGVSIHIEAKNYDSDIIRDILKQNNDRLLIPQDELDSGFITQVGGEVGDWSNGYWWILEVNYKPAEQGIADFRVNDGAVITFRLVSTAYNPWE